MLLVALMLVAAGLATVPPTLAQDDEGSIAVLLPDSRSSDRWENDDRRFLEAAFEEAEVEYSIVNAEGDDAQTQLTQADPLRPLARASF